MKSDSVRTVLVISLGFVLIHRYTGWTPLFWVAIAVGLVGVFSDIGARWLEKGWSLIGKLLGAIVPKVILTLFFYAILFPIALFSRLFGNSDPLSLKRSSKGLFSNSEKAYGPSSFEKPW